MAREREQREQGESGLEDRLIKVRRSSATVKGGRRFTFNALVVVGDKNGRVSVGYGKANEVPPAVEKATKDATDGVRRVKRVSLTGKRGSFTIPHHRALRRQQGHHGSCRPGYRREGWCQRSRRAGSGRREQHTDQESWQHQSHQPREGHLGWP